MECKLEMLTEKEEKKVIHIDLDKKKKRKSREEINITFKYSFIDGST
jgi:hypothetical protein